MNNQPKIEVPGSIFETLLNAITLLIFFAMLLFLLIQFDTLPDQVPSHYNGMGEVDGWGGKEQLFLLPIIAVVLWLGMTVLERYPHIFNYLNLTNDNAELQYKNGRAMMNVLKNEIMFFFSIITVQNIRVAFGTAEGLGVFFLPVLLIVVFGSVLFFIFRMLRY